MLWSRMKWNQKKKTNASEFSTVITGGFLARVLSHNGEILIPPTCIGSWAHVNPLRFDGKARYVISDNIDFLPTKANILATERQEQSRRILSW